MPESSSVARRYAAGIFELAKEEKAVDAWRAELAKLAELLQDEVLVAAFSNPAVGSQRRMELARLLAPDLKPQTENLLRLLVEHHRTGASSRIREEYERLADEASGIAHATITTAIPLDDADRQRYQRALAQRLGRNVTVRFKEDPSMIGGAAVQVGDHLIDGTVKTQLERLRKDLQK